ncbi:MAG: helix-turn-helix transcriptional regulator [Bacteroidota bacterium]
MSVSQRIKIFLESIKLTQKEVGDMVGLTKQGVSSFMRGKTNPPLDVLGKILLKYPELNARWLLTGEGHMLEEQRKSKTEEEILAFLASKKEDCDLCKEKDKRIRELERLIEAKEEVIEVMKKK